jgi:hypothetical protein
LPPILPKIHSHGRPANRFNDGRVHINVHIQLFEITSRIMNQEIKLFGADWDYLHALISQSFTWESIDQWCFWEILRPEIKMSFKIWPNLLEFYLQHPSSIVIWT